MKTRKQFKACPGCRKTKPRSAFVLYKSGPKKGTIKRAECRACARTSNRAYKEAHLSKVRELVVGALAAGCVDCGELDIVVLEFDHRDPSEKKFTIGTAISRRSHSLQSIRAEIAKCDVVCANCHARRTAKSIGSWRLTHTLA